MEKDEIRYGAIACAKEEKRSTAPLRGTERALQLAPGHTRAARFVPGAKLRSMAR